MCRQIPTLNSMQILWDSKQAKLRPANTNGYDRLVCVANLVEKIKQVSIHPQVKCTESGDE